MGYVIMKIKFRNNGPPVFVVVVGILSTIYLALFFVMLGMALLP